MANKFLKNITIKDAASGFYMDSGKGADFNGLRYLVGNTSGTVIEMYQEEEPQNSIKLDLSTIILQDINGVVVTPSTIEGKAALLSVYVSKAYTNTEIFTEGKKVGDENPFATVDVDHNQRQGLNSIFGDRIVGIRKVHIGSQFQYGVQAEDVDTELLNGGSFAIVDSLFEFHTGANVAGSARVQSVQTVRYIPGQEMYCYFTAVFSPPKADSYQRGGLYDDENGYFVSYEGAVFTFTRRRDGVDFGQPIDLASFNARNRYTLDPTKGNIYRITYGYLGFAPISLEVMKPNGSFDILAKIEYPNSATIIHTIQTFLPIRGEVGNTGNDTDIVLSSGSLTAGIVDGGGNAPAGREFTFSNAVVFTIATNTTLVTFRNKDIFSGKSNRVPARLLLISGANELNKNARWKLYDNPILEAAPVPVWADVDTDNSTLEYSLNAVVDYAASEKTFLTWNKFKTSDFFEMVEDLQLDLMPGRMASFAIETDIGGAGDADLSIRWSELF